MIVYQKAYTLSMRVFDCSKKFPKEEKYALTDQIRRSSRSIPANLAEAWAKKVYAKAFAHKLSDALGEQYETEVWLNYARDLQYINQTQYEEMTAGYTEVRKMLLFMINNPEKFFR